MRGYVIHEDKRFKHLDNLLEVFGDDMTHSLRNLNELDYFVFGIKGPDKHLRYHEMGQARRLSSDFFSRLKKGCILYTFMHNDFLQEMADIYGLQYVVFNEDEYVIEANADLTSEAVIEWLIANRHQKLKDSEITIFGFGHLAKALIPYLLGFQAKINIVCRNRKEDSIIQQFGKCADFDHIFETSDIYINTVPSQILDIERLKKLKKSSNLLDISSFPYGFDLEEAISLGLNAVILPGLPAKFAYEEAAYILLKAMKGDNVCLKIRK